MSQRTASALVAACLCFVSGLQVGCVRTLNATYEGAEVVVGKPSSGAVAPYSPEGSVKQVVENGLTEYLAVYVSVEEDLEKLVQRKSIEHLFYRLLPCEKDPVEFDLCSGDVFDASTQEVILTNGPSASGRGYVYSLYVPLDYSRIEACAKVIGGRDLGAVMDAARTNGLCVHLGGGKMFGFSFVTNSVRIPVRIIEQDIVVSLDTGNVSHPDQ